MEKEINLKTQVLIDNLMPWDVYFHSDTLKCDVGVEGGRRGFGKMSVNDVIEEIRNENVAFVGVDGVGGHAAFRVVDDDIYKFLFNVDKRSPQMTKDVLDGVFKQKSRTKLADYLKENFPTKSEKKALGIFVAWADASITDNLNNYVLKDIDDFIKKIDYEKPTNDNVFLSPLMGGKPTF